MNLINDTCDCDTCQAGETPCHFDCDTDNLCAGCREAYEDMMEMRYVMSQEPGDV